MNPDVTITISVGAGASTTSEGVRLTTTSAASALPPMPLEELQVGAASEAPAPQALDAASTTEDELTGGPPGPLDLSTLLATASSMAPEPFALGSLESVGGLPTPMSLEQLQAATGEDSAAGDHDEEAAPKPRRRSSGNPK